MGIMAKKNKNSSFDPTDTVSEVVEADAPRDTTLAQADGDDASDPDGEAGRAPADTEPAGGEEEPLRRELEALREQQLRLAAEYKNYRTRTERERTESWARAQGQIVEKLLDVLDDLNRVSALQPEATTVPALLEGVQLVERKFWRALEAAGLESIDAEGKPFDPTLHEALVMAPTEDEAEDETVAQVFQPGYTFKGTLLRPARVQVKRFGG
jgi:molecular chaperone GrpE